MGYRFMTLLGETLVQASKSVTGSAVRIAMVAGESPATVALVAHLIEALSGPSPPWRCRSVRVSADRRCKPPVFRPGIPPRPWR